MSLEAYSFGRAKTRDYLSFPHTEATAVGGEYNILRDMSNHCEVRRLGLVEYQQAWELQDRLAAEIAKGKRPPTLLLLEHPHTYTFGRRGHLENLLWDEDELARRGVTIHWVDRGGDVTYHGPGQLVGYPLLPLRTEGLRLDPSSGSARLPQADYVGYVRRLEEVLILALARLGVSARPVPGMTGVWVEQGLKVPALPATKQAREGDKLKVGRGDQNSTNYNSPISTLESPNLAKIAAIGVKVDAHGVTRHGFALNVNPDMSYWEGIIGCGLVGYQVTSLAALLGVAPPMQQVADEVVGAFARVFGYEVDEISE
jgi:lipoyl(octanoyl) transferase